MTNNSYANFMDAQLFQAATKGSIDILNRLLDGKNNVLYQITPIKNTVIHIAAEHGHIEFVRYVQSRHPTCFTQANSMGDTPLHVAARAGHTAIIHLLLSYTTNSSVDLELGIAESVEVLRRINNKGDTPLHDAVRNNQFEIVKLLIEEDPELLCLHNYAGESPLYMAVVKGELPIVKEILQAAQYSHLGPNHQTALHAAIFHNRPAIAKLLLESKQEIARAVDCNNRSALHFATTLGFNGLIHLLLKYDTSTTYILDRTGLAPIHIAALHGLMDTIAVFLGRCPDLKDLLDGHGRNVLHLAIEGREVPLVKYILRRQELERTLNKKDNNGNTPLHLATISFQPHTVNLLVKDNRVDRMEVNNEGWSALAIAMSQNNKRKTAETVFIRVMLLHIARPPWCKRSTSYGAIIGQHVGEYSIQWYKNKANVLMVVATLIATVSFAAGFTLPGGYRQEKGQDQGMTVLVHEKVFKDFIFMDITCLYFSLVAVAFLIGVQFFDSILPTAILFYIAQLFTAGALSSLMRTFLHGVALTVSESREIIAYLTICSYSVYIVIASFFLVCLQPFYSFLYLCRHYVYFRSWLNQFELLTDKSGNSYRSRLQDVTMLQCYNDD